MCFHTDVFIDLSEKPALVKVIVSLKLISELEIWHSSTPVHFVYEEYKLRFLFESNLRHSMSMKQQHTVCLG